MHFYIYIVVGIFTASIFTCPSGGLGEVSESVKEPLPSFAFGWLDGKDTFDAGDVAIIKIKVFVNSASGVNIFPDRKPINISLAVNGRKGNSSYISGVASVFNRNSTDWSISFIPIMVGVFNVLISDDHFGISDSSLHFQVLAGRMYPSVSVASWGNLVNEFAAGMRATVLILPKDAFGNNISSASEEPGSYTFTLSAFYENGSLASVLNITYMGWNEFGYVGVEFIAVTSGSFLLDVAVGNQTLSGSPLPFKVNPGLLDTSNCLAKWNYETNALQIFSKLEIFIHQQDQYGNLVPGLYAFDAQVVEKETNLSIPIADLNFKEMVPGIQLFSFSALEPGDFKLTIYDGEQNQSISNMPYDYTVFTGYCDGLKSVVNGSGLAGSVAGQISKISVYLNDRYEYPSPIDADKLQVQILRKVDSANVWPRIYPAQLTNATMHAPIDKLSYGATSFMGIAPAPSIDPKNSSAANTKIQTSVFDVIYTPEKSGLYEIRVFCGNIPLNSGHPYTKEVTADEVNVSLSGVVKIVPKVSKLVRNEIVVKLMDSFSNPVPMQQSKLSLEIGSINNSGSLNWKFVDNRDGSYVGYFLAKDVGTYEMCISFGQKWLSPCPFGVNVYSGEYFPKAYNDTLVVWEDESVSFDALGNDYFAGGNASIVESSMPWHGSLLQYGQLFRYTPYKGYFGNDSFNYTISDINENLASASVIISVLSTPPQFVSLPVQLQATEDLISPRFGGFPGFEIKYSDSQEKISVTLSTQFGSIFLSPMPLQFWQSTWNPIAIRKGEGDWKGLILEGNVDVINFALQSIQYLGNDNFSGDDFIHVSTINKNGINDAHVPVFVQPINDPPFIHVPEFIKLRKHDEGGSQIFNSQRDKFEFSIGDPDLSNFPGNESRFLVTLSMEVNDGILITNLPIHLINTTELKQKSGNQWQPLQTFVTISRHFLVKATGIRFRGTIKDCNNVMQQLSYQGGENGAVLTVAVNDMGNYGCYPDCSERMSFPLFAEATVNLIGRQPMSSLAAHSLGSAIMIEFIMMLALGVLLLFFTCKCAIALGNERKNRSARNIKISRQGNLQKHTSSGTSSENMTYFTATCSSTRSQPSNFCQRSRQISGNGRSGKDEHSSSQSSKQSPRTSFMPLSIEKGLGEAVSPLMNHSGF
ncbi:protein GAMETE EXPRESSED 2 [Macadamia integrifolia]|uniref:protein GAMETE EXPRESSED 2 n=1 Tax=Macadamia integrifolia TaxID=60698 RepID=UPI001C52956A|nr:protein GAMETE EXPRESSED 2 [Macadamia integrifolia]